MNITPLHSIWMSGKGALLLSVFVLGGCSYIGRPYSEIDPEGAAAEVRKHNGYFDLKSVTPGTAKLVMRSEGPVGNVAFSLGTESSACADFKYAGSVTQMGRGVLLPWIANFTQSMKQKKEFVLTELSPEKSIYIRGSSSLVDSTTVPGSNTTTLRTSQCGPIFSKLTPKEGHAYLVEFDSDGYSGCTQRVFDATNPDRPIPLPTEGLPICLLNSIGSK